MSEFQVKKALLALKDVSSWENLLSIPKRYNVDLETVRSKDDWFNYVNTTKFCNYFIAMNNGYSTKFTSVERNFRTIRAELRKQLEIKTQENSEKVMTAQTVDTQISTKVS
jgi:hypothetical protein